MTSIERTAYPRFKRLPSARELHVFYTPQPDEVAWARGVAGSGEHLLALLVLAKCFGRRGTSRRWLRCRRWWPGMSAVAVSAKIFSQPAAVSASVCPSRFWDVLEIRA